jgi:soluble lytic murein transglycosylase
MAAVRADNWPAAEAAVADDIDPVAGKLVRYFRLIAPNPPVGAGRAAEIAAFAHDNPDWPNPDLLERRRQEALALEPDGEPLATACALHPLTIVRALLRCADAARTGGDADRANALARAAWTGIGLTDPAQEAAFMHAWGAALVPEDQWRRFDALAWAGNAATAARQSLRLAPERRPLAEARLALMRNDATAPTLVGALPPDLASDPGLFLDRARYLRRANRDAEALALWSAQGNAAQAAAPAHAPDFWAERNALARRRLRDRDAAGAYDLVSPDLPAPDPDALFLAGFLALRRLDRAAEAAGHFRRLAALSGAVITQARAHYWLARAAAAAGGDPRAEYAEAARFPTTFYGQLALRALGADPAALSARLAALTDPDWTADQGWQVAGNELARAAALLTAWDEPRRAHAFLLRLDEVAPGPAERAAAAHLALLMGAPDIAVAIARRMGRDGLALPRDGWPLAADPPPAPVDPPVALGLIRQESSFDAAAVSPAGARGLMQLMPATAQATARRLGVTVSLTALVADPAANMRLGTAYLREVLDQFAGSLPLAIAAYNAGPHRVTEWLGAYGDPRAEGGPEMLDWMESIPFNETRNYVQRVLENVALYQARTGAPVTLPAARPAPSDSG